MKNTDFVLFVSDIPPEGLELELECDTPDTAGFALAVPVKSPLQGRFSLQKHRNGVLVRGEIQTEVVLECSRCLKEFPHPIRSDLRLSLEPRPLDNREGDRELAPENLDIRDLQDGTIDLRDLVAEQIHLVLPVKPLCSEECRGWCPRCGSNLNLALCTCTASGHDPRWDALKQLNVNK